MPRMLTPTSDTARAIWQGFVDYAVEQRDKGLVDIVTKNEWYEGLNRPRIAA